MLAHGAGMALGSSSASCLVLFEFLADLDAVWSSLERLARAVRKVACVSGCACALFVERAAAEWRETA